MGAAAPVLRIRGRAAELAVLSKALDRVRSGQPATVLLEGEPGIGKTRLLDQVLRDAGDRGMQVVAGRASELERARPFGLVAEVFGCVRSSLDPQRSAVARMLAAPDAGVQVPITVTSDPGLRFRVVDAFGDLAEDLALRGPLVVGVDDLQWADPSSLLTFGAIISRAAYLPIAVVGCLRPSPRTVELDRLVSALDAASAQHLMLRGLADDAVSELVSEAIAAEPGPGLLSEMRGAAGNPLFVTELLAALAQEGAITAAEGRADVVTVALPPTLRLTILRRIGFLPETTLQILQTASVLGSSFTITDLATVTSGSALDLSQALAEAVRTRVVEDDGTRLRFRHDLIRDAIYEDLPGSVRRALHHEAGQRLANAGAPALQVAEQLARGATTGDAGAIEWLSKAAREAAATSPDVAADLLDRATQLMRPTDAQRDRLLAERASNLVTAGRIGEALVACRELLNRGHDPEVEGQVRICLAHALLAHAEIRDALYELDQAASSRYLSAAEQTAALAWAGFARVSLGDLDGAAAAEDKARAAAAANGDSQTVSIAMATLAAVTEYRGQLADALTVIDEAVRLADQSPGRQGHRYPIHITRAHVLTEVDRLEDARSTLRTGMRLSEELGIRWPLASYSVYRACVGFVAGEWDDAISEIEASLEIAEDTGETYSSLQAHTLLTLISLHRNDLARATTSAKTAVSMLADTGGRFRARWAEWAHALVLEAEGNVEEAFETLAGCWDRCAELGLPIEYRMIGPDLVRLAMIDGKRERGRQIVAAVTKLANDNQQVPSLAGAALRCQGLVEDDANVLRAAADAYARGSRPFELAQACEDAGAAFARHGDIGQARSFLERAVAIYERLDAARDLGRTDALLREIGVRRGRHGQRRRPPTGWQSLTPSERTIADLVAEGLSNPQIGDRLYISRRTVQSHLGHIFAKLNLTTRAQLAANVSAHRNS